MAVTQIKRFIRGASIMAILAILKQLRFYLTLCMLSMALWAAPAPQSYARSVMDDTDVVSFARLGVTEKSLRGPFDSAYIDFALPANWKLGSGAKLQLNLNT